MSVAPAATPTVDAPDAAAPASQGPAADPSAEDAPAADAPPPVVPTPCRRCGNGLAPGARYCRQCGADQQPQLAIVEGRRQARHEQAEWRRIKGVVVFYAIFLGSIIPLTWLPAAQQAAGMLTVSVIDALAILAYWRWSGESLGPAFRVDARVLAWCAGAPLLLLALLPLNYGYHHLLVTLFNLHPDASEDMTAPFISAGYGLGIQLFSIAVMPGVWEELAFRGLIQGQLGRSVGAREAIVLSSLLFGIIHLRFFSLPYLVGLGAVLAILRQRSGSLLPGMVVHAAHNAIIVLLERHGW